MIISKLKYFVNRFYYKHRFQLINNEPGTLQKVHAALSYNIIWGIAIMLSTFQGFSFFFNTDQLFHFVFPLFVVFYLITAYVIFVKKIWRFVIHSYCIVCLAILYFEIYTSEYMIDIHVMLYATLIIFLAFSLLNNFYAYVYAVIVLASISFFLFNKNLIKTPYTETHKEYVAFFAMLLLGFIAFVCHHFIRSMYMLISKIQYGAQRKKVLSDRLILITEDTQKSLKVKEEFLSTMSHELRSPLNTVIGFAALLKEEGLSEKQLDNLHYLQYSAENLLDLINDVLDYNKFDSGNLILEQRPFGLKDLFVDQNSVFQQKIKNEVVRLSLCLDFNLNDKFFIGDEVRVQQLIYNLVFVANSVNGSENIALEMNLGKVNEIGKRELLVKLIYKGLNKYLAQVQPTFSENEGLFDHGMGESLLYLRTAISKKIAYAMNAHFHYQYDPVTNYSCIQLRMILPEITSEKVLDARRDIDFQGLKVLVVDDQELNVLLLTKILKKFGADVTVAYKGTTAVEKALNQTFDLILMDINLPEMNGFEATLAIRQADKNVRIIALTGEGKEEVFDRMQQVGMDGFLQKPIDSKSLSREMDRVLHPLSDAIVA